MSSLKTKFLNLHKWLGTDFLKRNEIVENFDKVDAQFEKVDSSLNYKTTYASQADFVDIIKSHAKYNRVRFKKVTATSYAVCVDNGNKHVTYEFLKDTNDDFYKLGKGFVGDISYALYSKADADTRTGTWDTATPPFYYATQVGATFTCNVTGTRILFGHRETDKGGIFEFVVDGDINTKKTISTWAAVDTGAGVVYDVVADGLDFGLHTVVGTFKGSDPDHAPNGGVPRGWVHYSTADPDDGSIIGQTGGSNVETKILLDTSSNKEIAINCKYNNITNWIPDHGVGVVFNTSTPKFLIDGREIDVSVLTINEWIVCSSVQLIQNNYIEFPNFSGTHIAEWLVTHSIGIDGIVSYSGRLKALQSANLQIIYPLMIPQTQTGLNETLTSIGNSKVSAGDDTDYYYPESDQLLSGCFISSSLPNYIAAGTVVYPLKTMRIGKQYKPDTPIRFWQRLTGPKLYWQSSYLWNVVANDVYIWSGKIAIGDIQNIYNYIKG